MAAVQSKRTSLGHKPRRSNEDADEIRDLKNQLADRDKQLKDQALSLAEMENNVSELHSTITIQQPPQRPRIGSRHPSIDDADVSTLRDIVREKNEKIAVLTAEFDGHRADFRSTIDTLELASTETERVYERRVEELTQEVRELQDRSEDVESVAQQLKQLEELVQELEEGLEDARRGEAEARGEVEFLRGEVERGRSELRREKDIAASALEEAKASKGNSLNSARMSRDLEQRDDEIRGLKAIIHSLSRDGGGIDAKESPHSGSRRVSRQRQSGHGGAQSNGLNDEQLVEEREARQTLERHVKELEDMVDAKTHREDELERQLKRLTQDLTPSSPINGNKTSTQSPHVRPGTRGSGNNKTLSFQKPVLAQPQRRHADSGSTVDTSGSNSAWCEICEQPGHDILTCTKMFTNQQQQQQQDQSHEGLKNGVTSGANNNSHRTGRDVVKEGLRGLAVSSPHHHTHSGSIERPAPLSPAPKSPAPALQQQPPPAASTTTPVRADALAPNEEGMVPGKRSGRIDAAKWCALCEKDGHESVDCPFEDEF